MSIIEFVLSVHPSSNVPQPKPEDGTPKGPPISMEALGFGKPSSQTLLLTLKVSRRYLPMNRSGTLLLSYFIYWTVKVA